MHFIRFEIGESVRAAAALERTDEVLAEGVTPHVPLGETDEVAVFALHSRIGASLVQALVTSQLLFGEEGARADRAGVLLLARVLLVDVFAQFTRALEAC